MMVTIITLIIITADGHRQLASFADWNIRQKSIKTFVSFRSEDLWTVGEDLVNRKREEFDGRRKYWLRKNYLHRWGGEGDSREKGAVFDFYPRPRWRCVVLVEYIVCRAHTMRRRRRRRRRDSVLFTRRKMNVIIISEYQTDITNKAKTFELLWAKTARPGLDLGREGRENDDFTATDLIVVV